MKTVSVKFVRHSLV